MNAETQFGTPLFERLPTGLRLTAAGEILMAAGGRWQKDLAEMSARIEDLRGLKRGHVTIAVIDALAKGYIPAIVQSVQTRYPGITIGVHVLGNDAVRQAIIAGEVDLGICFEPQSYRDLTVRAFTDIVLGFVTPAGHPLGREPEARFSSVVGHRLIAPAEPLAVARQIAVLEGATGMAMHRAVRSDNIQMIASLVEQGVGIGILTSLDVLSEVRQGRLAFTRISDSLLRPMTLALCTAAARVPSYAAGMVLTDIEASFGDLGIGRGAG